MFCCLFVSSEEIIHASEVRDVVFQSHFSREQAERDTPLERKAKIVPSFSEHAQVVASIQFQALAESRGLNNNNNNNNFCL